MYECVTRINKLLAERNTELQLAIFFDGSPTRPIIAVDKKDSKVRVKPTNIMAKYCPFCGEKYAEVDPRAINIVNETEKAPL